ncbi:hypothetical protein AcW2_007289 [Taiwanofungus camphoratus]|nr:hypothetical protein AcW2_007289 [Antrodia cinnamomea]
MMTTPVVVVDNGASTIKTGVVGLGGDHARIIPNAIVRSKGDKITYFGHELKRCRDYSSLHYRLPFEKGYLVDWDAQKAIWDGMFSSEVFGINASEYSLLMTEPYFNLPNIQDVYDQLVFEEYEFQSYYRCTPAALIPHGNLYAQPGLPPPQCMLVIDSGFSFTHVIPILNGSIVWNAVKRYDMETSDWKHRELNSATKNRCRGQVVNQPTEGACLIPSVEHDGRDIHYQRYQRMLLLCFIKLQKRHGDVSRGHKEKRYCTGVYSPRLFCPQTRPYTAGE